MGHGPWVFRLSSFVALMFDVRNEFSSWSRSNVDFLENKMEPAHVLPLMHTIVLNLENEMKKWYPKETVARVIFEALKFCVHALVVCVLLVFGLWFSVECWVWVKH